MGAPVRIRIVSPAGVGRFSGNTATSLRWCRLLRQLGHRVEVSPAEGPCEVLVALHGRKSAAAIARFRRLAPAKPIILALTGTDVYLDGPGHPAVRRSLAAASRVVVLQPAALAALPRAIRARARVVFQSAIARGGRRQPAGRFFDVAVLANLRRVKDPFRAELAARGLPACSRIRVRHVGGALAPSFARAARARATANPRYRWLGERSFGATRRLLASSRVLVLSSRAEGGANVISEAIVAGVPILCSRIPGSVGLLGRRYPGLFEPGDTAGLRALLLRVEREPAFLRRLRQWCQSRRALFRPARERQAWMSLLAELASMRSRNASLARVGPWARAGRTANVPRRPASGG